MTASQERTRSTAEARRRQVLDVASSVFSRTGFHATTVSDVAEAAQISHGYVLRLFGTKLKLFVAALEDCYAQIARALEAGADPVAGQEPETVLRAMADAYADLIVDRHLLMLQVHAQSASDVSEVRDAVRRGLELLVSTAQIRSQADDEAVQRFIAYGQLCHLVVTAELGEPGAHWARLLRQGIHH